MAKKKVAVLFGGASKEYEPSLYSAYDLITGLPQDKYEAVPIGITRAARWLFYPGSPSKILSGEWEKDTDCCSAILSPDPMHRGFVKIEGSDVTIQRVDTVFSVLHGKYGECGHIQGLCRLSGVPYIGSDHASAAVCSDKILTKLTLGRAGVTMPKFIYIERINLDKMDECVCEVEERIGYPCHVKSASCSPSFGSSFADDRASLIKGIKLAFSHHHKIIVEEHIEGRFFECAVYGNTYNLHVTSPAEHVTVYSGGTYLCKADEPVFSPNLPAEILADMERVAKYAFMTLGCKSYAKVGFILSNTKVDNKCITTDKASSCGAYCEGEAGNINNNGDVNTDISGTINAEAASGNSVLYCTRVQNVCGFGRGNMFIKLIENDGIEYSKILENLIEDAV